MITITSIQNIKAAQYDEIWAITRSNKQLPAQVIHVPELAPSWDLFRYFLNQKITGNWTTKEFQTVFVPRFLQEITMAAAQTKLTELIQKHLQGKHICLYCFCSDEHTCHRSILAGILQWMTATLGWKAEIYGVHGDYQSYGIRYAEQQSPSSTITIPKMEKPVYTMCFTGHRPNKLCGYDKNAYRPMVKQLTDLLDQYYTAGIRRFITGGAQGFDQLVFWAIHALKSKHDNLENIIYVPFQGQERQWAKTGVFSQTEYAQMLTHADHVEYLSTNTLTNKREVVHALYIRNETMVNHSDIVLALQNPWNDKEHGGTAHCVTYAKNQCKIIHQLLYETQPYMMITQCQKDIYE